MSGFTQLFRSWQPRAIGSLFIITASLWAFFAIADEVFDGDTQHLDDRILRALRSPDDPELLRGPRWMKETVRDMTALGGYTILMLTTFGVAGFLFLAGHPRDARFVLTAVAGGWILGYAIKWGFDRPRPDVVPHLSDVMSSSFPSGHSMMSAVVYLTLGGLLTNVVPGTRLKCYFLGVAVFLTLLVGFSRLSMGVHYPTDVLAGWCLGLGWAEVCWLVHRSLMQRTAAPSETPLGIPG
ncbi:MAG: phosphatase PAP2 family protein [Planctomycetaceae bacterium]|nr:phosphatase PAP2 family protein [Planctomycetaceae bacterium]